MIYTHCDLYDGSRCPDLPISFVLFVIAIVAIGVLYLHFRAGRDEWAVKIKKEAYTLLLMLIVVGVCIPVIVNFIVTLFL